MQPSRLMRRALALLVLLGGCGEDESACVPPPPVTAYHAPANRGLDLLVVQDNSGGTAGWQTGVVNAFPRFLAELTDPQRGLPELHVGVISTNVGIAPYSTTGCVGDGDDGKLQNVPRGACAPPSGYYILDSINPDGTRTTNVDPTSTLSETFACIARLGTSGCGLERPLESLKRALDGHRPENEGFLRDEAQLAVILIGDEDDCSAANTEVYDPGSTSYGPFSSFRCTEFGVSCDGAPVAHTAAAYGSCEPAPTDALWHPQHYAELLRGRRDDPARIHVFALAGDDSPFRVTLDASGDPALGYSCGDGFGGAAVPGVRTRWFARQFTPEDQSTLCTDDAGALLANIGAYPRHQVDECAPSACI